MEFRRLGDSDIEVSEISLGSWLTYSGGVEREQTEACTIAALEVGINFFDTANIYGVGAAETAWGEILKNFRREEFVLATKLFWPMDEDSGGLSKAEVHKQIDASLERLQTDYVDLYQCHRPDPDTPIEETMEGLTEVVEAGKAREIGFSEWTIEQIEASLEVPNTRKFVSSQPQYNMIWRAPEAELIPFCEEHDISQIVWSPLAQGVLTGKYSPGEPPPEDSRAASEEMGAMMDRYRGDEVLEAVQRLVPIAEDAGHVHGDHGARLVSAPGQSRLGDHRRLTPRAGASQRRGVGSEARPEHPRRDRRRPRRRRRHGAAARELRQGRRHPPLVPASAAVREFLRMRGV